MKSISTIICTLIFITPVIAQFPSFPPDTVTSLMDRNQMMWQLGVTFPELPSKLEDKNTPPNSYPVDESNPEGNWTNTNNNIITRSGFGLWNNYDDIDDGFFPGEESWRVGNYTTIDLLKMNDGTIITSEEQWWNYRRPELLKDVQEELWGVIPPDSILPIVEWSVESLNGNSGVNYKQKILTGILDISRYPQVRNIPQISAVLRIPSDINEPVPIMIVIGNTRWTPIDVYWKYCYPNGWGVCIFNANDLQPDDGAGLTSYLIGLCNKGNWRKPNDWGTLAAWGWGVSRLIDYFETDEDVDATKIGVAGHSRYGKATIVATAYDERIAIAFPSCAGSLGTKLNRRHWGQDLENSSWEKEYHWTAGNFFKWMGPIKSGEYLPRRIELCPVDAHSVLSLCAPRPVFLNAGTQDTWTDPFGIYLAGVFASPVYSLLGKEGLLINDKTPKVDVNYIDGNIGYRYHNGGHTDAPDWPAFFEFASKFIKTK